MEPLPIPYEWENYIFNTPIALEVSPWCMYSKVFRRYDDDSIEFFQEPTNIGTHGMLYNPTSFLIHSAKIFGATQEELHAKFRLTIGNKIYYDAPVWANCLRQSQYIGLLMIPPLMRYSVSIYQMVRPKKDHYMTVALFGKIARAIQ